MGYIHYLYMYIRVYSIIAAVTRTQNGTVGFFSDAGPRS